MDYFLNIKRPKELGFRVLAVLLVILMIFSFNIKQLDASVTYDSADFTIINGAGASVSDGNFTFTGVDGASVSGIAVDAYGIYLASGGTPSLSSTGTINITSADGGDVFPIETITVNVGDDNDGNNTDKSFRFDVTLDGSPTIVKTVTVNHSSCDYSQDISGSFWDFKTITFDTPVSVGAVHIAVTSVGTEGSVGNDTSIAEFVIGNLPAPPAPVLTYAAGTFTEVAANDGTIATTKVVTIANETFVATDPFVLNTHYTVANVPAGMTLAVAKDSNTQVTLSLTGTATAHANVNDATNLTITFLNAAFSGGNAASVTNYTKNDMAIDFNDPPSISINDVTHNEGNSGTTTYSFTVSLSSPAPTGGVSFSIATANNTATSGTDYTAKNLTGQSIPAGSSTYSFDVLATGDDTYEATESFYVNVSAATGATISDSQGVGTLTNDDAAPTVTLGLSDSPLAENGGVATVTATLNNPSYQSVTVNLAYTGTATGGGTDYTASDTSIVIAAGSTTGTVTITGVNDALDEADETVIVDISGVTNGTESGSQQVTATITDDDATPSLSINDPSVLEGDAGTATLQYTVTLSAASGRTVTVDYASANGTATTADSDYVAASGTLTFTSGQTTKTIDVTINGDLTDEGNQTVLMNLSNASNATISDTQGSGTITNDDGPPLITIGDVSVAEGNAGTVALTFTVTLNKVGAGPITVDYATADNTATTADSDYTADSGTLTIPQGDTTKTFDITINGDTKYEANETFYINLSNATSATISDSQGVGTITNDDGVPTVSLGLSGSPLAENAGTATVTATLSNARYQNVTVDLAYTGTATITTDYTAPASITITAGSLSGTATITGVNDTLDEADETVIVDISGVTNGTESGSQQVTATITDDDVAPSLSINDPSVTEGNAGTATLQYTVTLSTASGKTVTVDYTTANGTATTADSDYTTTLGTLTFTPGQTSKTIDVTVNGDTNEEEDETILVNLSNASNASISDSQGSGIITNDEADLTLPTAGGSGTITAGTATTSTIDLSWTAGSDNNTVAANLQYKVVRSASSNITSATDAEANGTTVMDWTANTVSKQATGLTASTTYYFNVIVKDEAGNKAAYTTASKATIAAASHHNDNPTTPPPAPTPTVTTPVAVVPTAPITTPTTTTTVTQVIVNDQVQNAGTTTTQTIGNQTTTTVTVDDNKINEKLNAEGQNSTVTIPIGGNSDVAVGELNGQTVKNMETKEAVLEIKTDNVTYTLPASEINIDNVSSQIGEQVALKDIKISVTVAAPSQDTVKIVQDTANRNSYQVVVKPIDFEISCTSGSKTVDVSKFNGYVERTVAIPDGVDPSKITTGIVLNADGTFSHVPTTIIVIGGKYYAKINSLTNSTYSIIWSPKKFADAENNWAKDAINDMGSRLVINGIDDNTFAPSRDITRAEVASIVVKGMGLMRTGTGKDVYKDVSKTDWYYDAVSIANDYGLIKGTGKDKFEPNRKITRQEVMMIMERAMELTKINTNLSAVEIEKQLSGFEDNSRINSWAKKSAAVCINSGVIVGKGENIKALDNITRAEVATIIKRFLQKVALI